MDKKKVWIIRLKSWLRYLLMKSTADLKLQGTVHTLESKAVI